LHQVDLGEPIMIAYTGAVQDEHYYLSGNMIDMRMRPVKADEISDGDKVWLAPMIVKQ
jgi:hypothetical protein